MNLKINHVAAIVCIIVMHILGFLWYGPLFGEKWMAMVDIDLSGVETGSWQGGLWLTNLVSCASQVYLLAWLFTKLNVTSGSRGAIIAFLVTFCMHHLPLMSGNMFQMEPYGLAWITGGFGLVALSICGFILGAWTKRSA